jgi:hypothetical protein
MGEMITCEKRQMPVRIMIYGTGGIGKTTFAASMPNPIFIRTEDGLLTPGVATFQRFCTIFDHVIAQIKWLVDNEHKYKTVVIDSLDWLQTLAEEQVLRDNPNWKTLSDGDYGAGWSALKARFLQVIRGLELCRQNKRMAVCLIAHTKEETHSDPEIAGVHRFAPKLYAGACSVVTEWCDMVLLATRQRSAALGEKERGNERILRTVQGQNWVAKSRYPNIPEVLPLSWKALKSCLFPPETPVVDVEPTQETEKENGECEQPIDGDMCGMPEAA